VQIKTPTDTIVLMRNQYPWTRLRDLYVAAPQEKKADQSTAGQYQRNRFRH